MAMLAHIGQQADSRVKSNRTSRGARSKTADVTPDWADTGAAPRKMATTTRARARAGPSPSPWHCGRGSTDQPESPHPDDSSVLNECANF